MAVEFDQGALAYCCGVDEIGEFYETVPGQTSGFDDDLFFRNSGTGMYISTFVDDSVQKEAYDEICERFDILYQSPLMLNRKSGNYLFLLVYKDKV